ncbi:hypothetical protein [Photobacterium lutimaris]|uniref:PEP-CTERM protein-sorting domain-containing protein n=1 Tax=Photobacterium lutimaris TaxID=388278 RepID=A0A2T3J2N8_9GAMM|nr:hypothetical protein [Photobacterium lutimaris]PSU35564.1 hypothetical protein C9I99_00650 [Photobacterium lutimaris]TDR78615.1 putative secreted protein with PEP-CTERM sorting signal [Photobacterium lutimaris]
MKTSLKVALLSLAALSTGGVQAAPIDLTFDTPFSVTLDTVIHFSPADPATTSTVMNFTNVGVSAGGDVLDARVTATAFGDYVFDYQAPNYKSSTVTEPNGDIGFLYRRDANLPANVQAEGGLVYLFELFDGTGAKSNTYTDPFVADEFEIIVYDVDGELDNIGNQQSEDLRVFKSDGLFSYTTGNTPASLTATDLGSEILFEGPGTNFNEDDPSGAVLLNYANTSNFTLQFESITFADIFSLDNGVFSAIDGNVWIDFEGPAVVVSEPETLALFSACLLGLATVRRRSPTTKLCQEHCAS